MSNPNPYPPAGGQPVYPGQLGQQQGQLQNQATAREEFLNYRFTPEELRVIAECETESFYYRSLPFSLGIGSATFLAVKNGILKASPKFGPWPKVIGLGFVGYIAGRLSYTKVCQEKMMALPNSRFGEMLRKNLNRKSNNWDMGTQDAGAATALSLAPFQATTDSYSDEFSQPNALNLDTNRPQYSGLDDTYTPTREGNNDLNEDLVIPQRKSAVTYDELRQKNRDDYAKAHFGPNYQSNAPPANYVGPVSPPGQPLRPTPGPFNSQPSDNDRRRSNYRTRQEDEENGGKSGPKNRYGDIWSE